MKINKIKALVGVLATSAVVSLVGSISGTVAWLQYNTRARVEMYGTTAKTTENLQIRTITGWASGTAAVEKVVNAAAAAALNPADAKYSGKIVITTNDGKVYTSDGSAWAATDAVDGAMYTVNGKTYAWDATNTKWKEAFATYGAWKSALLPEDISAAADVFVNLTDNQFKPVTNPEVTKDAALGEFYSHPLAGHEEYNDTNHAWKKSADGYLQFAVQFRVVDVDGKDDDVGGTGASLATLAQPLYMTDLSFENLVGGKDVKSALRMHIENVTASTNKLIGLGAANATASFTTQTHGNLDLDGDGDLDTVADVPNNYSWTANSADLLDYGNDALNDQTYYNASAVDGSGNNTFFATQDEYGALVKEGGVILGQPLGTTTAGAGVADDAHLTFKVTLWLEGWHSFANVTPASYSRGTYASAAALPTTGAVGEYVFETTANKMYVCTKANVVTPAADAVYEEVKLGVGEIWNDGSAYKRVNSGRNGFEDWADVPEAMWSDLATVGAEWNMGLSFAVPALEPIQE